MFLTDGKLLRNFKDLEALGIIVEYRVVRDGHGKDTYDLIINNTRIAYGLTFSEFAGMVYGFAAAQQPVKNEQVKQLDAELAARAMVQHLESNHLAVCNPEELLNHEQMVNVFTEAFGKLDSIL